MNNENSTSSDEGILSVKIEFHLQSLACAILSVIEYLSIDVALVLCIRTSELCTFKQNKLL